MIVIITLNKNHHSLMIYSGFTYYNNKVIHYFMGDKNEIIQIKYNSKFISHCFR